MYLNIIISGKSFHLYGLSGWHVFHLSLLLAVMKTTEIRNEQGTLTGFRVSNLFLSRHGIPKIVSRIPGAQIVRKQKRFRFSGPDDFCEFIVDGKKFLVIEPFGDNSEFWIVSEPPEECSQMKKVENAFVKHRVLFGLYAG